MKQEPGAISREIGNLYMEGDDDHPTSIQITQLGWVPIALFMEHSCLPKCPTACLAESQIWYALPTFQGISHAIQSEDSQLL